MFRRIENGTTTYKDARLVKFLIAVAIVVGILIKAFIL